jgi:hypothetical protein
MRLGLKAWWPLVLGLALVFTAGRVLADTEFPIIGGSGNDGFEDRCPGGEFLLGFNAQMGASMNMVQIVCTAVQHTTNPGQNVAVGQIYDGPLRGGRPGGGPVNPVCPNGEVLTGMLPDLTASGGTIKDVRLWCGDGSGKHDWIAPLFSPYDNPYANHYDGNAPPTAMWCPTGEAGIGVRGREGLDINAISLICGAFSAAPAPAPASSAPSGVGLMPSNGDILNSMMTGRPPPPPTTTAHVASNSGEPIKTTGRAAGSPPPPDTRPVSLFNGFWNVTSSQGGSFTLDVLLVAGTNMGVAITGSDASQKGDGHGHQIDVTHAEWTFAQPALGRGGAIDVTVTGDGSTFTGLGQATGGGAITWAGTKTTAPAAAH